MSLPSYTGSALKREQNSCNGYLSLLYFCLNAIELSPRNVICRLSISILYIFLYITKAKFFLVSNFFMNRFPSLSAFNWASRPHQPAIYSLFWVKNLEVAWKSIFFSFHTGFLWYSAVCNMNGQETCNSECNMYEKNDWNLTVF